MTDRASTDLGFAAAHDAPIPYLQRIRDYYAGLGYGAPYAWAHYAHVPFHPLAKPLAEASVTIITTAAPYQPGKGDQGPGAPYNAAAKFFTVYSGDTARDHDLRISHIAIDRAHTTAEDPGTWFPLPALRNAAARGRIGRLAPRFHGLPTNRSHRTTLEVDCPEVVARCRADGVDAALLVANCPVCHQSVSLAARLLEEAGIATVVMGSHPRGDRPPQGRVRSGEGGGKGSAARRCAAGEISPRHHHRASPGIMRGFIPSARL
jgi:D-proline reductase (dithiol) PrdB